MATTTLNSLALYPTTAGKPSSTHLHYRNPHSLAPTRTRHLSSTIRAIGTDLLGDMGGRDPFPAELESNFGDKVLGNMCTEHKILIPNTSILSLTQQSCFKIPPYHPPMTLDEAKQLLCKIVGWRVFEDQQGSIPVLKIKCVWKVKDYRCGAELISRIAAVAEEEGHFPALRLEKNGHVAAEMWTEEIGGLSLNDFIVAAKMDQVKTSDLVPRKRVWA